MSEQITTAQRAKNARAAALALSETDAQTRNAALAAIADALDTNRARLIAANTADLARAREEALEAPLLRRLKFDDHKIDGVIAGIHGLIALPDPVGKTLWAKELAPGLNLYKISTPIGVLGIIFESRPDAFVQISTLALKSGNAVLLKGGHEALETNCALEAVIADAGRAAGLPDGWVQNLESREDVDAMLALDQDIDLLIPRGSNAFVRHIMEHTKIPVMGHADGICHTYIDKAADLDKAVAVAVDGKTQYPAVCNATETLLVHKDVAPAFLPKFREAVEAAHPTRLKGDAATRAIIEAEPADESDWGTEYLDYVLSVKVVDSLEDAIDHINRYGSGHTDAIVSEDAAAQARFARLVDSACVFTNASTRFSDGYRFGFGAEVGISTGKLHARGPVGLDGLMSMKYILQGHGDTVADFADGTRHFTHKALNQTYETES